MLERYPAEGWKTNVLGTLNLLRLSAEHGVEQFVNISTDKAADATACWARPSGWPSSSRRGTPSRPAAAT